MGCGVPERGWLAKRDGTVLVVRERPHPTELVDPAWCNSVAKVMRTLGDAFLTFPQDYDQHVALRKKVVAEAGNGAMQPSHVAIAALLMMQAGAGIDAMLALEEGRLLAHARGMNLQN